jgi:glycosyltransferase involved in cell wall biosynthesis
MEAASRPFATLTFVVPGRLDTRTGGYGYDRHIIAGLRNAGWVVHVLELNGDFPFPSEGARQAAVQALRTIPDGALVLIDGLALGVLPAEAEQQARRLTLFGLVHHPLADEIGLAADVAAHLAASEARALAAVRHVFVTSETTASALERLGVTRERVTVVEPGTTRPLLARGSTGSQVELLSVASVTPRKGHQVLLSALATMRDLHWHLTCVGSLERDASTAARIRTQIAENALADRVSLAGEVDEDEVGAFFDRADVFVLPTFYEGYGMVIAEAIAHGLPIVSSAVGPIPALVGDSGALLVPPGDVEALAGALSRVVRDPSLRAWLAEGSRRIRGRLPTWDEASARMAAALVALGRDAIERSRRQ